MTNVCKPAPMHKDKRVQAVTVAMSQRAVFASARFSGHEEPALTDIINDPITRRLMDSDGVAYDHLMDVIKSARTRLRG